MALAAEIGKRTAIALQAVAFCGSTARVHAFALINDCSGPECHPGRLSTRLAMILRWMSLVPEAVVAPKR